MDPLSIAAACVGLLSGLTTLSTKIRSLTIDARNTNKEVNALQSELDSFQRSLSVFYGSGLADNYPDHLRTDLDTIIRQCRYVVDEIDSLLDKVSSGSLSQQVHWSFTVRDEVLRLHRNLEGHKSAITIAIAFASMSMNRGIKSDTSSIRSKAARIPEIQGQLAAVLEAVHALNNRDSSQRPHLSPAMQRFLQEAYTESINGSLVRSNTSRTYGSTLPSITDPFDDPKFVIEASMPEQPGLEVDDGYQSGNMTPHSTATLRARLDTPLSCEAPIQSSASLSTTNTKTRVVQPVQSASRASLQPSAVPSLTKLRKAPTPASNDGAADRKPRFSLARLRQKRSSSISPPDRLPHPSASITCDSLLDLASVLSIHVFEFISRNDSAFEPTARNTYELSLASAHSSNNAENDAILQNAVHLHQTGDVESATLLLKDLAGKGHISSQIMYALCLRHGWGCTPDPGAAVAYLHTAVKVAIGFERHARDNDTHLPEIASDELKLALFEIANSLRYGWGCPTSAASARAFYRTAAELGDVDAMHELAWCYITGFGGKKDKFEAAQVLRRAEGQGSKMLGNSWIWKEKYDAKSC